MSANSRFEHPAGTQRLFVVQELVLTMKRLKKTVTAPWTRTIEASHFFMLFMVTKLVRLFSVPFMVDPLVMAGTHVLHG